MTKYIVYTHTHIHTPSFFIYSSVGGHLGCFRIFAIVNNPAMNIGVHVCFLISGFVFYTYTPRNEIAGSCGSSVFSFWDTAVLFSTVAAPIYIPIIG